MRDYAETTVWGRDVIGVASWYALATGRLLDKGLIRLAGELPGENDSKPAFIFTPLGYVVKQSIDMGLKQFQAPPIASAKPEDGAPGA